MSRRGDNIHKRKDGRWEGRYKCGVNENGTARYRSVYGKTYSECKQILENAKANIILPQIRYPKIDFGNILQLWLNCNKVRLKGSTITKYTYMINTHILPDLGNINISLLNATVINNFLDKKLHCGSVNNSGLSASYVRTIAIIIEAALKFAVAEGYCKPMQSPIHKPPLKKNEVSILSPEYQKKLEEIVQKEKTSVALGTAIAMHTGLRIGEICALQWDDIDFENDLIYIRHTVTRVLCNDNTQKTVQIIDEPKTPASKRVIPISSVLRPILNDAIQRKNCNYVVSQNGSFANTRTFDMQYRQMLKRIGIKAVNFHTIRHTFATKCLESGMDIKTLSDILGHASATITLNTYVHTSIEAKKLQIEKLYNAGDSSQNYGQAIG